jgi:hypothetical protein
MKRRSLYIAKGFLCLTGIALVLSGTHFGEAATEKTSLAPGIPRVMLFEAYVIDSSGKPLPDGRYNLTCALYTNPKEGSPIWVEEHQDVQVSGGNIGIYLGEGTVPNPLDIPFDQQYFLGVRLDDGPEMVPRWKLTTSAYSFRAKTADEVPDASITNAKLAPLSVTDDKIESVSWDKFICEPDTTQSKSSKGGPGPSPSRVWYTRGNTRTDPDQDYLGTADSTDFSLRTNNVVRMAISAAGSVAIKGALTVEDYITSRKSPNEGGLFLADPNHGLKRVGDDDVHLYTTGGNLLLEMTGGGQAQIISDVSGPENNVASYPLLVDAVDHGVAIRISNAADATNNYVSFWDNSGMAGRIEGMNAEDLVTSPEYIFLTALDVIELALAAIDMAGAAGSVNVCAGFGVVTCPPVPSLVIAAAAKLVTSATRVAATQAFLWAGLGVAYESGYGDYAEWLERLDQREKIDDGDIVGVFGGKVTKSTEGAQQILAVSRSPIVLGNMPAEGEEHRYEKVSFLGQVPVKVLGIVKQGDYIIPSGLEDGTGMAVSPELMTADEHAKVLGRAWSASDNDRQKYITVAVGLNPGDVAAVVKKQQAEIGALRAELASRNRDTAKTQAELEKLRHQLVALGNLCQEVAQLKAALVRLQEQTVDQGQETEVNAKVGGSLVTVKQ